MGERRLLRTRRQVQRAGPGTGGRAVAAGEADRPCPAPSLRRPGSAPQGSPAEPQPAALGAGAGGKLVRRIPLVATHTHTFPAPCPPQRGSGRASASEQPPPAFGSASTRPAPGRKQQPGRLQDTKRDSALGRGAAGPQRCRRALEKQLRRQEREVSTRRADATGRRPSRLCRRL